MYTVFPHRRRSCVIEIIIYVATPKPDSMHALHSLPYKSYAPGWWLVESKSTFNLQASLLQFSNHYNLRALIGQLSIYHLPVDRCTPRKAGAVNLRQIQLISSPVLYAPMKYTEIMKSGSWRKYSVVVLKEIEKVKRQICLREIHHCFVPAGKWNASVSMCFIDFLVDLMLNSSQYFRKRTQIRDLMTLEL